MLTNDNNEKELIKALLANKYEIDLIGIELSNEKIKLCGKGYIFLDHEGNFLLKFFSDLKYSEQERLKLISDYHSQYESSTHLVSDFYELKAEDQNESVYECQKLIAKSPIDNVSIFYLQSRLNASFNIGSSTRVIFSGKYSVPTSGLLCSKTTVGDSFEYTDNKEVWEFELIENIPLVFSKFEDYIELIIVHEANTNLDHQFIEDVIKFFGFVLGMEPEPVYINIVDKGHTLINRRNMLQAKSSFIPPLPINHNRGNSYTENHSNLFKAYFIYLWNNKNCSLPVIHKRVVSGSRNYLYAFGLILAIQIENLCKDYYKNYYIKDDEFLKALDDTIKLLKQPTTLIKNKIDIISRLCQMKPKDGDRSKLNVKNILNNLSKADIIEDALIKSWIDLRSVTAHGDEYSNKDWNKFLKDIFYCTNLYYQLIFNLIKYSGSYSYFDNNQYILKDYLYNDSQ